MDHALQGNWGLTLLELGQHKCSYLAVLQASSPNGDAAAVEASAARLRQEARQALVRAGQLFREVVLVRALALSRHVQGEVDTGEETGVAWHTRILPLLVVQEGGWPWGQGVRF